MKTLTINQMEEINASGAVKSIFTYNGMPVIVLNYKRHE